LTRAGKPSIRARSVRACVRARWEACCMPPGTCCVAQRRLQSLLCFLRLACCAQRATGYQRNRRHTNAYLTAAEDSWELVRTHSSPGADVGESGAVPAQMWASPGADAGESRRRRGRVRCSPGADVGESRRRRGRANRCCGRHAPRHVRDRPVRCR
jgi:hypothetical protein